MDALREFREIGLGSRLNRLSELMMKETQKVYTHYGIDFDPYLFPAFKIISFGLDFGRSRPCPRIYFGGRRWPR